MVRVLNATRMPQCSMYHKIPFNYSQRQGNATNVNTSPSSSGLSYPVQSTNPGLRMCFCSFIVPNNFIYSTPCTCSDTIHVIRLISGYGLSFRIVTALLNV